MIGRRSSKRSKPGRCFAPRLPESAAVGQAIQATLGIKTRLLQGFFSAVTRNAHGDAPLAIVLLCRTHQAAVGPRLVRALPLDPGQALAVGADDRRGIEISAFGQQLSQPVSHVNGDQSMRVVVFFDGEYLAIAEEHATIAFIALSQRNRHAGVQCLAVQLLIAFVDEHQGIVSQAERTAAVLVHPAAHAEALRREAALAVGVPVPDATGAVFGAVFVPEQACRTDVQPGEVNASGDRLCGGQGVRKILR